MTCWLVASHQQYPHRLCIIGSIWLFERQREKQWQHLMVWCEMKRSTQIELHIWSCLWKIQSKSSKIFSSCHCYFQNHHLVLEDKNQNHVTGCHKYHTISVSSSLHVMRCLHNVASVQDLIHFCHTCLFVTFIFSGSFLNPDSQLNQKTLRGKSLGRYLVRLLFCAAT